MIPLDFIEALKFFVTEEVRLIKKHNGQEKGENADIYFNKMYQYVSAHPEEFVQFDDSGVSFLENEFAERVKAIRQKIVHFSSHNNIPAEVLFIPRLKINKRFRNSFIHVKIAEYIRHLFDHENDENFNTLRVFMPISRKSEVNKWLKSKNGKNFYLNTKLLRAYGKKS